MKPIIKQGPPLKNAKLIWTGFILLVTCTVLLLLNIF